MGGDQCQTKCWTFFRKVHSSIYYGWQFLYPATHLACEYVLSKWSNTFGMTNSISKWKDTFGMTNSISTAESTQQREAQLTRQRVRDRTHRALRSAAQWERVLGYMQERAISVRDSRPENESSGVGASFLERNRHQKRSDSVLHSWENLIPQLYVLSKYPL